jgi:zinc protease
MKILSLSLLLLCAASPGAAPAAEHRFFPYPYTIDDLPNGLRLITVPTDNPNLIALYLVVQTGSRNEVEPGKSGYAHFFEHMMFRGSERFTSEQRDVVLKRAGAAVNAYTSDDRTTTPFSEDLESIEIEPIAGD